LLAEQIGVRDKGRREAILAVKAFSGEALEKGNGRPAMPVLRQVEETSYGQRRNQPEGCR
jgi:hypothetical protein